MSSMSSMGISLAPSPAPAAIKREGDISDAFASMSGKEKAPLPDRYRAMKLQLVAGYEAEVVASWRRLLKALRAENNKIASLGSAIIPEVQFSSLDIDLPRLREEIRKRGVAVIRGVVPEQQARAYKEEIEEYVRQNPHTKGFPADKPQVIELYWSAPQLRARAHPNLIRTQKALMTSLWHTSDPAAPVSLSTPLTYADRLRIRQPGDAKFALGPHMDGGSVERWEPNGYGRGHVYDAVFRGAWESLDPWEAGGREAAVSDMYNGLGACSMFRAFQGWLSMSWVGPGEGTLLVNPSLKLSIAYMLLRPFFRPITSAQDSTATESFLHEDNWEFTAGDRMTSDLQGATPGHGQEFPPGAEEHPHLELERTMVHVPKVKPGDFVVWHCDTIHAVDKTHTGASDSSVLYIPVCPMTEGNASYLARQRRAFLDGTPGPDFPGGKGESEHVGRPDESYLLSVANSIAVQSMGLKAIEAGSDASPGARTAVTRANAVLGF